MLETKHLSQACRQRSSGQTVASKIRFSREQEVTESPWTVALKHQDRGSDALEEVDSFGGACAAALGIVGTVVLCPVLLVNLELDPLG